MAVGGVRQHPSQQQQPLQQQQRPEIDADIELLRKYGLDKFHLSNCVGDVGGAAPDGGLNGDDRNAAGGFVDRHRELQPTTTLADSKDVNGSTVRRNWMDFD